mmetsp:Transcript_11645/g.31855  ORF Transcript_11645/g.31855 Transcript_11645/m.31855 type:complete len:211 (+) Transcript_11645:726-1358(+)
MYPWSTNLLKSRWAQSAWSAYTFKVTSPSEGPWYSISQRSSRGRSAEKAEFPTGESQNASVTGLVPPLPQCAVTSRCKAAKALRSARVRLTAPCKRSFEPSRRCFRQRMSSNSNSTVANPGQTGLTTRPSDQVPACWQKTPTVVRGGISPTQNGSCQSGTLRTGISSWSPGTLCAGISSWSPEASAMPAAAKALSAQELEPCMVACARGA